ncbi:putative DNA helicase protein [Rosellinia necatrix]|uniref:DNA 3'-5' helicase n=1 Tax=Rosellinia necatrix TaxID=77044 RepID=A0A1S8AAY8_ROSNE|nr:putative DNA helicase protein [Rosellinia necatrix]
MFLDELDAATRMMQGVVYVGEKDSHITPVVWLCDAQTISKEARSTITWPPRMEWIGHGQLRLVSLGTVTSTPMLSKLMQTAIDKASQCLQGLLLQPPTGSSDGAPTYDAPVPGLSSISDDRSNAILWHSFLEHSANQTWVSQARVHLIAKIDADPARQQAWSAGNIIKPSTAKSYEQDRRIFLQKLAVAIHLTAGQPSRRTEQQTIRWQNSLQGGLRNVMISDGHVGIRYLWYKRRWTANQELPVWRFLPPLLSRILVIYISTVLPFAKCVQRATGNTGKLSYHLYSARALYDPAQEIKLIDENTLLSDPMVDITSRVISQRVTIADYRHIAIAFCREYMHNQTLEAILGEGGPGGPEDPSPDDPDGDDGLANIADAQAAHSTAVATMVYAREYDTGERFSQFFRASLHWHLIFHLDSPARGTKRFREREPGAGDEDDPALEEQVQRLASLRPLATQQSMRRMYKNSNIDMREHQKKLFDAMDKTDKVVYVAGTGSGKSVAFTLPAYVQPDGCNIVIQPTRALQRDTYARLSAMSISVSIWDPQSTNPSSSVVLVTPEAMARREWKGFAQRQRLHRRVDRIMLDEAQEVLLADQGWRRRLLDIRDDMDLVSPRQVYLTGTLPPSQQAEFINRLRLGPDTIIVRAPTVRDNLRYEYVKADVEFSCAGLIRDLVAKIADQGQRAIVFTTGKVECDLMAEQLSIPRYHRDMSPKEQQDSLQAWQSKRGAIVATTTLAVGVDFNVSLVVCIDAFNMLMMCQQFGRAGRDNRPATCILVAKQSSLKPELREYAIAPCKRDFLSRYLDGVPSLCGFHHNACGGCRLQLPSHAGDGGPSPSPATATPMQRSYSSNIPPLQRHFPGPQTPA